MLTFAEMLFKRDKDILKMSCSESVKRGEAVEGDEAEEGLPVDSDAAIQHCWWCNRLANAGTQPQPSKF